MVENSKSSLYCITNEFYIDAMSVLVKSLLERLLNINGNKILFRKCRSVYIYDDDKKLGYVIMKHIPHHHTFNNHQRYSDNLIEYVYNTFKIVNNLVGLFIKFSGIHNDHFVVVAWAARTFFFFIIGTQFDKRMVYARTQIVNLIYVIVSTSNRKIVIFTSRSKWYM